MESRRDVAGVMVSTAEGGACCRDMAGLTPPRFALAIFGFALTTTYIPTIAGGATTPRWAIMALALLALPFLGHGRATWAHVTGAAFVAYALASLAWSPTLDSHDWLLKLLILAGIFILGSRIEDLRPFWTGAALGLILSGLVIAADALAFHLDLPIDRTHGIFTFRGYPAGLFANGLYYAEAAALVAVALAASRQWLLAAIVVAPFVLLNTVPRGPVMAILAAGLAWLLMRPWRPGLFGCAGILAALLTGATWLNTNTVGLRIAMWQDVLLAVTPWGYGYGSYRATIPFHSINYDASRWVEVAPHNEALGILYELGAPGLTLAAVFCGILLWPRAGAARDGNRIGGAGASPSLPKGDQVSLPPLGPRLILIAFITEAVFGFGLHLPVTACAFVLTAGHLSRGLPAWNFSADRWRGLLRSRHGGFERAAIDRRANYGWSPIPICLPVPDRPGPPALRIGPPGP